MRRKRQRGDWRGSVLVEAAMLYPFVIVVSVCILYMMVCFYQMNQIKVRLDIWALRESGREAQICDFSGRGWEGEMAESLYGPGYTRISCYEEKAYGGFGVLASGQVKRETGRFSCIREADLLRKRALAEEWLS